MAEYFEAIHTFINVASSYYVKAALFCEGRGYVVEGEHLDFSPDKGKLLFSSVEQVEVIVPNLKYGH